MRITVCWDDRRVTQWVYRLRQLGGVMTKDIEQERRRLAERIEQDVLSVLKLLQAQTQTYRSALRNNPDASMALSVIETMVQQSLNKARYLQNNLHPTTLETLGLEPALQSLAAEENRIRGITITLTLNRLRERLPTDVEFALFRAVQTLLDSAVEHAHASHFALELQQQGQTISLLYEDNGKWYPPHIHVVRTLADTLTGNIRSTKRSDGGLIVEIDMRIEEQVTLTPRETEIIAYVAEGLTNKEIASQLHLSARTINFHLDNIYTKLDVRTRTEAAMIAVQNGWIDNPVK